ncbi:hypothetical protein UlMin_002810 [Ulmus minor]
MGLPLKRPRKASDSDNEFVDDDDIDIHELIEQAREEDDESEEEDDEVGDYMDSDELIEEDDDDDDEEEADHDDEWEDEEEEGSKKLINVQNDAAMEELEKEYMNLRHQEQDILKNLKRHKDEDLLKGQAVKNQKALWDKTLEFRITLQKAFSSSNRLPQEPIKSSFCDSDKSVNVAYSELITSSKQTLDSLLELKEALLEKNPSILQAGNGKSGQSNPSQASTKSSYVDDDSDWSKVSDMHQRISAFRDKSIDKWQRKTQVTTGAAAIKSKLHAFNQNISEQVASYMRDPSRIIKQMQLRRSTVGIFGAVAEDEARPMGEETQSDGNGHVDGDPELIDDSEFYQQLLKEFFEMIDPTSNETALYALKRLQTKKRKIVDRRASKGRKIRYHVHEKIVNFMAPQPNNIPSMASKLFENLFGLKTQKPASVMLD